MHRFLLLFVLLSFVSCSKENTVNTPLFEQLQPSHTGIGFTNALVHDVSTKDNLLDFDYFYNGAGVAAGDLNNDGLKDLVFAGNQVPNQLYLNKGSLKFEDASSAINSGPKNWSNGVTLVDINNDNWLDIYISQGGPRSRAERKNLLYINDQKGSFTEQAEAYGLADEGISTHTAFFDFDKDGDLDCIVMNESELYGLDPVSFYRTIIEKGNDYYASFSHLYLNENGKFTDISREAGLVYPTFGLGLSIADINEDGWPDIYMANDYYQPDLVYINKKDGSFAERSKSHLQQMSFFGMGVDIADINNDGHQDIFVLDMASKDHIRSKTLMASMNVESFDLLTRQLGFNYQYMFNSLQLNNGQNRYENIAQLSGVSKTDWSWAALIDDVDLDGLKDIFVTNGYRRYGLDNDFKSAVNEAKNKYQGQVPLDIKKQLYESMPSESLPNVLFKNKGQLKFDDVALDQGLQSPSFSNGAILSDLDNDGDLDLVTNNIDQPAMVFKNNASSFAKTKYLKCSCEIENDCLNAKITLHTSDEVQFIELKAVRGYMSSMTPEVIFGINQGVGKVDSVTIEYLDGSSVIERNLKPNQSIIFSKSDAGQTKKETSAKLTRALEPASPLAIGLNYSHQENVFNDFAKEILLPQKQSQFGPAVASADINQDGFDDIYLGGAAGVSGSIYISIGDGTYEKKPCIVCNTYESSEDVDATFLDYDNDGDLDLYVMSGGNEFAIGSQFYADRLYENLGKGEFVDRSENLRFSNKSVGGVIKAIDIDNDGDLDLIVGNRIKAQNYPIAGTSFLLTNENGVFTDKTAEIWPSLSSAGIVNSIVDYKEDGVHFIMLAGEWEPIRIYQIIDDKVSLRREIENTEGWWWKLKATDINGDGLVDIIAGNVGENIKHHPSIDSPFKVFAEDFDSTGSLDIVLSSQYKSKYVPARGRECSSQQMPFIQEKFPTYQKFASASLVDVYGNKLEEAYQKEVVDFHSKLLLGQEDGTFKLIDLPILAQTHPVREILIYDIDHDGRNEYILAGSLYETEVETPRLDGGHGLIYSYNNGEWIRRTDLNSSFYIPGNVRRLISIHASNNTDYLVGIVNDGPLSLWKL